MSDSGELTLKQALAEADLAAKMGRGATKNRQDFEAANRAHSAVQKDLRAVTSSAERRTILDAFRVQMAHYQGIERSVEPATKVCPMCAETVLAAAKLCRF